jgi:hypothetical protein
MTDRARRPAALVCTAAAVGIAAVLTGCGAASGTHPATSAPAPAAQETPSAASPGVWGTAQELPGSAALNQGGATQFDSVSCASAGNCSAGGLYVDGSDNHQAFVVSEVDGSWQQAQEVPGSATLNQGGFAAIFSVSCASAGNCSAGGEYTDSSQTQHPLVVDEVNGTWQQAVEAPGTAVLTQGTGTGGAIVSVSCASAGNCSAGGDATGDGSGHQAFVVSEVNGSWQQAEVVPGTATLDQGGGAAIQSVSCASAGNCSAGGYYTVSLNNRQAFLVSEVSGAWQQAEEVPGTAALDQGDSADLDSVSCASAGNCSAGGDYTDGSGEQQAFVVSEVSGSWQPAEEVPGTATLNQGNTTPGAGIDSVSCASAGNCGAGGYYTDSSGHRQAFVVAEVSATWQQAEEVPGTVILNQGGDAGIFAVSCASAGNCSAGGGYTDGGGQQQAFVVSEVSGTWLQAQEVPGTVALNLGSRPGAGFGEGAAAGVDSVSCASAGDCSAGGDYLDGSSHQQAFVIGET